MTRPPTVQPLNLADYDRGYVAHLRGQGMLRRMVACDWLNASWRAGWSDAGNDLKTNPELAITPKHSKRLTGAR